MSKSGLKFGWTRYRPKALRQHIIEDMEEQQELRAARARRDVLAQIEHYAWLGDLPKGKAIKRKDSNAQRVHIKVDDSGEYRVMPVPCEESQCLRPNRHDEMHRDRTGMFWRTPEEEVDELLEDDAPVVNVELEQAGIRMEIAAGYEQGPADPFAPERTVT